MSTSVTAAAADYGPDEAAMQAYLRAGERRAYQLWNRGPIRFEAGGSLHPAILDAYWRCGFYVFEGVPGKEELEAYEVTLDILAYNALITRRHPYESVCMLPPAR